MTPILFAFGALGAGLVVDHAGRTRLAADVRLAMKRADLTVDYVARVIDVPANKLSDQLNGKASFTAFWKFFAVAEMCEATDFRSEFLDILADRINRIALPPGVSVIFARLDATPKRMAKATLTTAPRTVTTSLPFPAADLAHQARGQQSAGALRCRFVATGLLALLLAATAIGCARRSTAKPSQPWNVDVPSACKDLTPDDTFWWWWYGCGKDSAGGGGSGAG